jgi:hypothetical protein
MSLNSFVTHRSLASARSTGLPYILIIKPENLPAGYVPTATRAWAEKLALRAKSIYACHTTLLCP